MTPSASIFTQWTIKILHRILDFIYDKYYLTFDFTFNATEKLKYIFIYSNSITALNWEKRPKLGNLSIMWNLSYKQKNKMKFVAKKDHQWIVYYFPFHGLYCIHVVYWQMIFLLCLLLSSYLRIYDPRLWCWFFSD